MSCVFYERTKVPGGHLKETPSRSSTYPFPSLFTTILIKTKNYQTFLPYSLIKTTGGFHMKRKWVLYGTIIMLVAMCTGFAFGGDRKVKVGGRIMVDYMFPDSSKKLESTLGEPIVEGAEFRRARLFAAGMLYERIKFKAQYDFAGGDADFKDLYLELVKIPILGGLRIGHFHAQFSFCSH